MEKPEYRCTTCGAEFTQPQRIEAGGCTTCGAEGVPMAIADDTTIKINIHELRILCMWADNYARGIDTDQDNQNAQCVGGIVHRLNKQLPDVALTMGAEIQGVADHFGTEVAVVDATGSKTVKPKPRN